MIKHGKLKATESELTFDDDVLILDNWAPLNLCSEIKEFAAEKAGWKYTNYSQNNEKSRHWGIGVAGYHNSPDITNDDVQSDYIQKSREQWDNTVKQCKALGQYWDFLKENSPMKDYLPEIPTRALFNGSTGGHGDIAHTDSQDYFDKNTGKNVEGPRYVTHILYLNNDLGVDDGGQTDFYNQDSSELIGLFLLSMVE